MFLGRSCGGGRLHATLTAIAAIDAAMDGRASGIPPLRVFWVSCEIRRYKHVCVFGDDASAVLAASWLVARLLVAYFARSFFTYRVLFTVMPYLLVAS